MIDDRFIIQLNGKSFITYEGLLTLAHEEGLRSIVVDLIQVPNETNHMTAISKAVVTGNDGQVFVEYGDASPESVSSRITPHIIRMSATRAKARALRDFTNVGMTAYEELNPNEAETAEPATLPQVNLLKRLSSELNVQVAFDTLTKQSASELIDQLNRQKQAVRQQHIG